MRILISGCLLGLRCRFDGASRPLSKELLDRLKEEFELISICPEQLGGLATPREPAERVGGRVVSRCGVNLTDEYLRGAEEALKMAREFDCRYALMKERSPSCGSGEIYDGSFEKNLIAGDGVTVELLRKNGIEVFGEGDIEKLFSLKDKK